MVLALSPPPPPRPPRRPNTVTIVTIAAAMTCVIMTQPQVRAQSRAIDSLSQEINNTLRNFP